MSLKFPILMTAALSLTSVAASAQTPPTDQQLARAQSLSLQADNQFLTLMIKRDRADAQAKAAWWQAYVEGLAKPQVLGKSK